MQTGLRDGLDAIGDKARYVSAAAVRLKDRLGHNESDSGMWFAHRLFYCHDKILGFALQLWGLI